MSHENLFWDTCVFIRFVVGDSTKPHFEDICRFVEEAKLRKRTIHFSTLTFAEMKQDHFKGGDYGSIREFFADLGSNFYPIAPDPNIMMVASEMRSAKSTNPGRPGEASRELATPDAIILATCLHVKKMLGISDVILHSTDEGKGKTWAGRCIPLIGFEDWYPEGTRTPIIQDVCDLRKDKPLHPEPMLEGLVIRGRFPDTGKSA